jgi:DNA-binding CsgD family transcriptional regulator
MTAMCHAGRIQLFATAATKFMKESCKFMQGNVLTNFMHDITFTKGQISMLVSDEKVFLFYCEKKIPTLCTDDSGRTLAAGIYLNKTLENSRKDCAILMPLFIKVGKQLGQNYGKNSLHVVTRENDCQHLYSLFFDMEENDFLHWVVNNGSLLQDFINEYNLSAKDIILEAKAEENRIVLPTFSDFSSSLHLDNSATSSQIKIFHKNLHMPIYLSNQQGKCFQLLLQGKSTKEIGLEMKLSYRTVEHYLEEVRKQLGCSTTRELIISYMDQLV